MGPYQAFTEMNPVAQTLVAHDSAKAVSPHIVSDAVPAVALHSDDVTTIFPLEEQRSGYI